MSFDFFKLFKRETSPPQPPVDPQQPLYYPPDTIIKVGLRHWNPKPPPPQKSPTEKF